MVSKMNTTCLLNFYVLNDELKNTCDFNPDLIRNSSGVYEVFRVIEGVPLFLNEHIGRFFRSAEALGITNAFSREQIKSRIRALIEANSLKSANIHFQFLETESKQVIFLAWIPPFKYPAAQQFEEGIAVKSLPAVRDNPQIKRTNLPARLKADEMKEESGMHEVILVNEAGLITEGSRSNIFFVKNKQLFTPELNLVLPGITQSKIFEVALKNNIPVKKTEISLQDANLCESAFITSTSNKVLPIKKLDELMFNPKNETIQTIKNGFEMLVKENLSTFSW
jgi:branched-chain amino acid aminotransferase